MKFSAASALSRAGGFARRLRWINLPGAVLLALLQRTPVVRVAAVVEEFAGASPLGAVLRSATAAVAALGAVHSLAGATQVVASVNSVNTTVGTPLSPVVGFVTTGAPTIALSYIITGVPPGLTVPGLNPSTNILNITNQSGSGTITGTPTTAGSFSVSIQAWEFSNAQGSASVPITILFTIAPASASGPPVITSQPASLTSAVGESATFIVGATSNPAATYQWKKNGVSIAGAIGASLTLSDLRLSDAGNYFVEVTNSFATVTSATATLVVNETASGPEFLAQPSSQTVATGATAVFTTAVGGAPTPVLQWLRNNTPIVGATSPTLVLSGANVIAGNYTVTATNSSNAITSNAATLTLSATANVGRLTNLSILTTVTASDSFFFVGTVLGGGAAGVAKPLLVRAVGPSLTQIGVPNVLADPKLTMLDGTNTNFALNDNWGGTTALSNAFTSVGAFPFTDAQSKDAAVFNSATPVGSYTVAVAGVGDATGTVIAELYDATPVAAFNASTPRLVDVSVLKQLAAGSTISAGFTIGGATAKTVLVRAIGPGLATVGVTSGFVADPHLVLFNGASAKIAENDNWGGDPQLRAAMTAVGAFAPADAASKDAVLLLTLPPGSYSAVADGLNGSAGYVLVEVYDVP